MRSAARPAHGDAFGDDDVAWIRVPILIALHTAAWIVVTIERMHVTFLLVGAPLAPPSEPTEHEHDRSRTRLD